jgi:hypothetical protein
LVSLELARYRTPGPDNDRYNADQLFKDFVHTEWLQDTDVNELSPFVVYKRDQHGRATVPRPSEWSLL